MLFNVVHSVLGELVISCSIEALLSEYHYFYHYHYQPPFCFGIVLTPSTHKFC